MSVHSCVAGISVCALTGVGTGPGIIGAVISWTYSKDGSRSSGSHKAWLDGIMITDYALLKQSPSLKNPIPPGVMALKPQH